jgi:hypothetical protein
MSARRVLAGISAIVFCSCVQAADKPCSAADSAAAQKAIDRVVSWAQLNKAYLDYKHCDKDSVADVYTDALLRLAVEWKNVDAFAAAMKDAGFKEFVTLHLKSPAAKDDVEAVYSRTKSNCPKGMDAFCAELGQIVREERAKPLELMKPMDLMKPLDAAKPAAK